MVNALSAANAYKNQLKLQQGITDALSGSEESTNKPSFSQLLENGLQDAVDTQNKAEGLKLDALSGKADITELVTAISNAELALNTIVSIRDRAISAYQDIIRMPI